MADPVRIYYGSREAMVAEVAAWDPTQIDISARDCAFLVMPLGDEQYDTEWFRAKTEARNHAKWLATQMGGKVAAI